METCDLNGTSKGLASLDLAGVALVIPFNPFKNIVISSLNELTDSNDTIFGDLTTTQINATLDELNGEII